jgi:CheY-like chemotaxis protein
MPKVLVVEDDHFLGTAYKVKLTKEGYDFRLATDGEEVMTVLQEFMPDVILLDLVMPRKDGFAVLGELKKDPKFKDIPVIVASNLGQQEDHEKAKQLGAVDYVTKSELSLDAIVEKIAKWAKPAPA